VYRERYDTSGTGPAKRIIDEVDMPPEIQDFLDASEENDYFQIAGAQFFKQGNPFTEFIPALAPSIFRKTNYIAALKAHESKFVRAERQDSFGQIRNYFYRGNAWGKTGAEADFPIRQIRAYDPQGDFSKPMLYHTGDPILRPDDYYYSPVWWGSRVWVGLANIIPQFHTSNLRNGYTIRYHIKIPKNYFDDGDWRSAPTEALKKEYEQSRRYRKQQFLKTLNEFLAGVEKTGRAIVTEYTVDAVKGAFPGIEIIPLNADLQDEALLKLKTASDTAVISSMQMHPTLASIETQGKLSSGTEIRNAYLMYVAIQTPVPRKILLKPLTVAQRVNGWDKTLKFGFRDMHLPELSSDKTGIAPLPANGKANG
jgi:hypothetical protein